MKPQMAPQAIMATGFTWAVPPLSAAAVEFPAAAGIAESDVVYRSGGGGGHRTLRGMSE